MSASEQQLRAIAESPRFEMMNFPKLHEHLRDVDIAITSILRTSPSWKGATADTAVDLLKQYAVFFREVDRKAYVLEAKVGNANLAIDHAVKSLGTLPSTVVPPEIAEAVGTTVPFQGVDIPVNGAVGFVANLLAGNREKAAKDALETLQDDLRPPRQELANEGRIWPPQPVPHNPAPPRNGDDTVGDDDGTTGDGVRPPGGYGDRTTPPGYTPPTPPRYDDPRTISDPPPPYVIDDPRVTDDDDGDTSIDGDLDPTNPTTGGKDPRWNPPGTGTGGGGGSGLVPGLGGAGAAAGLAAAARAGGMGAGGMGAAATGAGARLGSGLSGGAGAAGGGGASAAGAAGGRGGAGTGMMGGGGAGGAAEEKQKRSGLGGLIAPKLEDDEELGPRSAAADAGGRDQ